MDDEGNPNPDCDTHAYLDPNKTFWDQEPDSHCLGSCTPVNGGQISVCVNVPGGGASYKNPNNTTVQVSCYKGVQETNEEGQPICVMDLNTNPKITYVPTCYGSGVCQGAACVPR